MISKVLLDSNPWIDYFQGNARSSKVFEIAVKHHFTIIIPEVVLFEVSKKIQHGEEKILSWIIKKVPTEVRFLKDSKLICNQAENLKNQFSFCHVPDNKILATAQANDAVLVTRDSGLLKTANFVGVMACKPKDFGGFVSVS